MGMDEMGFVVTTLERINAKLDKHDDNLSIDRSITMALMDFSLGDVGSLFTGIREAITGEKIKDPVKVAEMNLQLTALEQKLEELQVSGQLEINKIEASNANLFVSGWRPAIGWVAVSALFMMYTVKATVFTAIWVWQCYIVLSTGGAFAQLPLFPELGAMDIIGLVFSMLGVAGMRSWEKLKGIDTKAISVAKGEIS